MKKVVFNINQIEYDTGKAILIRVPHSKKKVWIPSSFISNYGNRMSAKLVATFKYQTSGGEPMSAEELAERFGSNVIDIEIHRPEKLEAQHIEPDDSLKR